MPEIAEATPEPRRRGRPTIYKANDDSPKSDVDRLKLALWYIGKCGDVETAERVFRAAVAATNELRVPVRS